MSETIQFKRMNLLVNSIGNLQWTIEPTNDPDLGYKMGGYKDASGVAYKFLAKGKPGLLKSLRITDFGTVGFVKNDVSGNLLGGQAISGGDLPNHNEFSGLQGGQAGQYYHLNNDKYVQVGVIAGGLSDKQILYGSVGGYIAQDSAFTYDSARKFFSFGCTPKIWYTGADIGFMQLPGNTVASGFGVYNGIITTLAFHYINSSGQYIRSAAGSSTQLLQSGSSFKVRVDNYQGEAADTVITDWREPLIVHQDFIRFNGHIGIRKDPGDWHSLVQSVIDFDSTVSGFDAAIYHMATEFGMVSNAIYDATDNRWEWSSVGSFGHKISINASGINLQAYQSSHSAGDALDWSESNYFTVDTGSSIGTIVNFYQKDYDFTVNRLGELAFHVDGATGNIGIHRKPDVWHSDWVSLSIGDPGANPYKSSLYQSKVGIECGLINYAGIYDATDDRWEATVDSTTPGKMILGAQAWGWYISEAEVDTGDAIVWEEVIRCQQGLFLNYANGAIHERLSDDANGMNLSLVHVRHTGGLFSGAEQAGEDGDEIFTIYGTSRNDAGTPEVIHYGKITCKILDASDGTEDGKISIWEYVDGTDTEIVRIINGKVGIRVDPLYLFHADLSSNVSVDYPKIAVSNSLGVQGDGSTTWNFASIDIISGNGTVAMQMLTSYDSGSGYGAGSHLRGYTNHPLHIWTNSIKRVTIDAVGIFSMYNFVDDASPVITRMEKNRGAAGHDSDGIGIFAFRSYNDAGTPEAIDYAFIKALVMDASDGTEDGHLGFYTMAGGLSTQVISLNSGLLYYDTCPSQAHPSNYEELYIDTDTKKVYSLTPA